MVVSGLGFIPFLLVMGLLGALSACFSAAEAAFFCLRRQDVERLRTRGWAGTIAWQLSQHGEHLLTGILFCNLLVNVAYFTISSLITLHWQSQGAFQQAAVFATSSVLILILFSEMLPKTIAALIPSHAAVFLALPVFFAMNLVGPILPALRAVAVGVRRMFWRTFRPEPYLRVREVELAVRISQEAAAVLEEEQSVLENLVQLSDLRAEEIMRPRTEVHAFKPPVTLAHLQPGDPFGFYVFLTDREDEAFSSAVSGEQLLRLPSVHADTPEYLTADDTVNDSAYPEAAEMSDITQWSEPVIYVPWNLNAAQVLRQLLETNRNVAAVINEFGETIGIITIEDLLSRIFTRESSRSELFFGKRPIVEVAPGVWHVTGLTSVHRLCRYFGLERPVEASHTVAGIFQEQLGRLPQVGDVCRWADFELRALQVGRRGVILAELRRAEPTREEPR